MYATYVRGIDKPGGHGVPLYEQANICVGGKRFKTARIWRTTGHRLADKFKSPDFASDRGNCFINHISYLRARAQTGHNPSASRCTWTSLLCSRYTAAHTDATALYTFRLHCNPIPSWTFPNSLISSSSRTSSPRTRRR